MTLSDPPAEKEKQEVVGEEAQAGPVATDDVILATAGYDHTIKFWAAHTGVCTRTLQVGTYIPNSGFVGVPICSFSVWCDQGPSHPQCFQTIAEKCSSLWPLTMTCFAAPGLPGEQFGDRAGWQHDRCRRLSAHPDV